jgi:hypothetical protein
MARTGAFYDSSRPFARAPFRMRLAYTFVAMSEDGNNFNSRIEGDITMRVCRLAEELRPFDAQPGQYDEVLREMLMYPPLTFVVAAGGRPQVVSREPWQLAILAISNIHKRLWEIARPHWRESVGHAGELGEIWELQAKMDVDENHWREMLRLPLVDSQS